MNIYRIQEQNWQMKRRLAKIKKELQNQIYMIDDEVDIEEIEIEGMEKGETIEEMLERFSEMNEERFGERNYRTGVTLLNEVNKELFADIFGERSMEDEEIDLEEINSVAKEQAMLWKLGYCYDRIERIFGSRVYDEKKEIQGINMENWIEEIVKMIKKWNKELLKIIRLVKDSIEIKEKNDKKLEIILTCI